MTNAGGAAVLIAQQQQISGLPLLERSDIGLAMLARKDHQIRLPMAKLAAITDFGRAGFNPPLCRDHRGPGLAAFLTTAVPPGHSEQGIQLRLSALSTVDMSVDALMRYPAHWLRIDLEPAGNLLR